jgi:hypothetical protein
MKIDFDQEDFNMLNEYIIDYVTMMNFSERELLEVLLKYIPNKDKVNVMRTLYMLGEPND